MRDHKTENQVMDCAMHKMSDRDYCYKVNMIRARRELRDKFWSEMTASRARTLRYIKTFWHLRHRTTHDGYARRALRRAITWEQEKKRELLKHPR